MIWEQDFGVIYWEITGTRNEIILQIKYGLWRGEYFSYFL